MRRILLLAILILVPICAIVAADDLTISAYGPMRVRSLSMGGTGTASARFGEVLYSNPALIDVDNQYFAIPSVSFSLYNVNKLVQPGGALDILLRGGEDEESLNRALNQLVNSIGPGEGEVASAQASLGFISGIMGLGLDMGVDVLSQGSGGESSTLMIDSSFALTLAMSLPVRISSDHSISFGIAAHLDFRGFTIQDMDTPVALGGFTAGRLIDIFMEEDAVAGILNGLPVAFGFAIPIDIGVSYDWRDVLTLGLAMRNLNGRHYMQTYSGLNQLYYMLTGGYIGQDPPGEASQGDSFTAASPFSLDFGIALGTPAGGVWDWIDISWAFDLVDITGLFTEDWDSIGGWIGHMRTGLELRLMRTFELRAGINAGYLSFGFAFDFQIFKLDIAYATLEFGDALGDKPLDLLTISLKLGLDS